VLRAAGFGAERRGGIDIEVTVYTATAIAACNPARMQRLTTLVRARKIEFIDQVDAMLRYVAD
jgi:hypothetical protein